MKILLVKPDNISDHIQPSIGLGILANILRNAGHSVMLLDFIKEKIREKKLYLIINDFQPDIIGFQCYTFDIFKVKNYLSGIRKKFPEIKLILGGPHPSTLPNETLIFFDGLIDYIFLSEAEISLKQFCEGIPISEIQGIGYLDKLTRQPVYSYPKFLENIDDAGMPAWDLIKPETFPPAQHGAVYKKFPIAPIMLTRGCPFLCTFCAGSLIMGRKLRKRSVVSVINEIKYLYHERGIREFHFIDDNFTMDRQYVISFLNALKELNFDISWSTPNGVRMDSLDDTILELMKKTGLYLISLGIESGSDRILKNMKKSNTVEKIKKYTAMIHKHGIDIAGFFILGFPGETKEEMIRTIEFSLELPLIRANYFTFLPFPGTEAFKELELSGELNNIDWKEFLFMNATYAPAGITRKELKSLQRRVFLKNLLAVKSPTHLKYLIIRFWHWFIY